MKPDERVRALIKSGALSEQAGKKVLEAVAAERRPGARWELLLSPYERFGGSIAAGVGFALALLSVGLGRLGCRFDGFLDLHMIDRATARPSFATLALDQVAAFLAPAFLAWGIALAFGRRGRIVDFVGAVGLARAPYVLAGALIVAVQWGQPHDLAHRLSPRLVITIALGLAAIAWSITLHLHGFRNASGLEAKRSTTAFIVLVVVAEIVSKVILSLPG
jgi:hypothetical protein